MTLTELKYVIALAREKHFGKAAKACHVSQPTLSVAINKLESELGVAIFERDRSEVRITEVGQQIVRQSQRAIEEVAAIKELAQAGKSQLNSALKVGAIYTVAPYLFPNLIPKLKKIAPYMPLLIEENFTSVLRTKLQQGEVDAIFISLPFTAPNIVTKALFEEPLVVLLRNDHPLSKKTSITPADLATEELLFLGEGHCFRDQVLEACPNCYRSQGFQRTVEGSSLETLRHMVASGMGMTILPATATQIQFYKSVLCTRPLKGKVPRRTIALAWRASFPRPKAISALIKAMQVSHLHGVCLLP